MGCQFTPDNEAKVQSPQNASDAISKLQSSPNSSKTAGAYKKLMGLQLDYAQKGIETVSEYINIPESTD
jgi:hypothetical protein